MARGGPGISRGKRGPYKPRPCIPCGDTGIITITYKTIFKENGGIYVEEKDCPFCRSKRKRLAELAKAEQWKVGDE